MKNNTKYGKRRTASNPRKSPKIQYFLAFEGICTEVNYFKGVKRYRDSLGISDTINIVERRVYDRGYSHPKKVYSLLIQHLKEHDSGINKVNEIATYFNDWYHKQPNTQRKFDAGKALISYLSEKEKGNVSTNIDENILKEGVFKILDETSKLTTGFSDFLKYLQKERKLGYRKGDKACIIIDRDPMSFNQTQYEQILKWCSDCEDFIIKVYVSNPRFEFWLLLHFLEAKSFNDKMKGKIMEQRSYGQEPYLESLIHKYMPSFSKRNLAFEELLDKVMFAISNEKFFCEDIHELKDNLGTNIGCLLEEMMVKNNK